MNRFHPELVTPMKHCFHFPNLMMAAAFVLALGALVVPTRAAIVASPLGKFAIADATFDPIDSSTYILETKLDRNADQHPRALQRQLDQDESQPARERRVLRHRRQKQECLRRARPAVARLHRHRHVPHAVCRHVHDRHGYRNRYTEVLVDADGAVWAAYYKPTLQVVELRKFSSTLSSVTTSGALNTTGSTVPRLAIDGNSVFITFDLPNPTNNRTTGLHAAIYPERSWSQTDYYGLNSNLA